MNNISDAFDKRFGLDKRSRFQMKRTAPRPHEDGGVYSALKWRLTKSQLDFCRFSSLGKGDLNSNCPNLIVLLKKVDCGLIVEEVRRNDFSLMQKFKRGAESSLSVVKGVMPISGLSCKTHGYDGDGYYQVQWRFTNRNQENVCEVEVDPSSKIVKMQEVDVIDCLYKVAMNMDAGPAEQLSKLHDTLDKQLQEAGEDIFVYELLQNANDYPHDDKVDVEFRVVRHKDGSGYLCFRHTGAVFTARNVAAICSANDDDKSNNAKAIGYKGIGFKPCLGTTVESRSGRAVLDLPLIGRRRKRKMDFLGARFHVGSTRR